MTIEVCRPLVNNLFDGFALQNRGWRDRYCGREGSAGTCRDVRRGILGPEEIEVARLEHRPFVLNTLFMSRRMTRIGI